MDAQSRRGLILVVVVTLFSAPSLPRVKSSGRIPSVIAHLQQPVGSRAVHGTLRSYFLTDEPTFIPAKGGEQWEGGHGKSQEGGKGKRCAHDAGLCSSPVEELEQG